MIESLYIRNYKNIKGLEIPTLRRVNLFWGKNNVGKSTLLEALAIYASNGDLGQIYEILKFRGEDLSAFGNKNNITVDDEINAFTPLVSQYDRTILSGDDGICVGVDNGDVLKIRLVRISTLMEEKDGGNTIKRVVSSTNAPIPSNAINSN